MTTLARALELTHQALIVTENLDRERMPQEAAALVLSAACQLAEATTLMEDCRKEGILDRYRKRRVAMQASFFECAR